MNKVWDWFALIFIIAILYLMVKPTSLAPNFIKGTTDALSQLIKYSVAG